MVQADGFIEAAAGGGCLVSTEIAPTGGAPLSAAVTRFDIVWRKLIPRFIAH